MAIALDASTPAIATTTTTGAVSATITACPANAVIVAMGTNKQIDSSGAINPTISDNRSLTWTQKVRGYYSLSTFEGVCTVWYARNGAVQQDITVTTTGDSHANTAAALKLMVFTGALASGDPFGATATAGAGKYDSLTLSVTTTAAGSFCGLVSSDNLGNAQPPITNTGTGFTDQSADIGVLSYWFSYTTSPVTSSGTVVTFDPTAVASQVGKINAAAWELKAEPITDKAGTDSGTLSSTSVKTAISTDTNTLTGTASLAATSAASDTASLTSTTVVALASSDTAGFADTSGFGVSASDTATLAEVTGVGLGLVDTATLAEVSVAAKDNATSDNATLAESASTTATMAAGDTAQLTETVQRTWQLRTPTVDENLWTQDALFGRYRLPRGVSLLVSGATVTQTQYPNQEDLSSYDHVYLGGHIHQITDAEVAVLTAAGYGAYIDTI